jgi:cytochrome c biogenesis protein CcdA
VRLAHYVLVFVGATILLASTAYGFLTDRSPVLFVLAGLIVIALGAWLFVLSDGADRRLQENSS